MRSLHHRAIPAALLASCVAVILSASAAGAYPGAPWFRPGAPYAANFPDPAVVVDGDHYVAYATATGGAYLPAETSTDLMHWTARPAYDPGAPENADPYFNDALPRPAVWGAVAGTGRMIRQPEAPGVLHLGRQWVLFYALRLTGTRYCLSRATATSALGPFQDTSKAPLLCDTDPNGSLDPQPFLDANGRPWLLWKSEGVPGHAPTRLWTRQLDTTGHLLAGSHHIPLLATSRQWEGNVIESPSMVFWHATYWLFYSGNEWASARYAIGYARCAGPAGPCTKVGSGPLLASMGSRLGPGGGTAFVDRFGRLRLAHHYWNAPYTNYPAFPNCQGAGTCTTQGQRRLAVEELVPTGACLRLR